MPIPLQSTEYTYRPTCATTTNSTNEVVWRMWTSNAATTWATASTTIDLTWNAWAATASTYTVTSSEWAAPTWAAWVSDSVKRERALRQPTPEEAAATVLRAQEAEQRREAAAVARRIAIAKADKLLESVLNDVQREHLKETESFLVVGKSGKLYRIRRGRSGNVDELAPNGRVVQRYCAHPIEMVPDGDTMVAQKLMLECDEVAFLGMANRHPTYNDVVPPKMLEAMLARHCVQRVGA